MNTEAQKYLRLLNLTLPYTLDELKVSYHRAVKIWHPDTNKSPNANEVLQKINAANAYLIKFIDQVNAPERAYRGSTYWDPMEAKASPPKAHKPRPAEELARPTLYRQSHDVPKAIHVPADFLKTGGTIFLMLSYAEVKFQVPPNASSDFILSFKGKEYSINLVGVGPVNKKA